MILNLVLGTFLIAATVIVHTFGLLGTSSAMHKIAALLRNDSRHNRLLAMVVTVFGVFATITVEIWLWAAVYHWLGFTGDFESALYFSAETFSTVGYGDFVPPEKWRLLAGMEAISGFILVGWSTAFLVVAGVRIGPFREGEHF